MGAADAAGMVGGTGKLRRAFLSGDGAVDRSDSGEETSGSVSLVDGDRMSGGSAEAMAASGLAGLVGPLP